MNGKMDWEARRIKAGKPAKWVDTRDYGLIRRTRLAKESREAREAGMLEIKDEHGNLITQEMSELFLKVLEESNVHRACLTAGISFKFGLKKLCDRDKDFKFRYYIIRDKHICEAEARKAEAQQELYRRGKLGVPKLKFNQGEAIYAPVFDDDGNPIGKELYVEYEYSDKCLELYLKAEIAAKFNPPTRNVEMSIEDLQAELDKVNSELAGRAGNPTEADSGETG